MDCRSHLQLVLWTPFYSHVLSKCSGKDVSIMLVGMRVEEWQDAMMQHAEPVEYSMVQFFPELPVVNILSHVRV